MRSRLSIGKVRPSQSLGNLNWLSTNQKGRICFRVFPYRDKLATRAAQSSSLWGFGSSLCRLRFDSSSWVVAPSTLSARLSLCSPLCSPLRSTPPEILQLSGRMQVIKENLQNRMTAGPPTFSIQRGRESSISTPSRDPGYDSGNRG
jgi:hypothetical protein